jgi:hypothetical protein
MFPYHLRSVYGTASARIWEMSPFRMSSSHSFIASCVFFVPLEASLETTVVLSGFVEGFCRRAWVVYLGLRLGSVA